MADLSLPETLSRCHEHKSFVIARKPGTAKLARIRLSGQNLGVNSVKTPTDANFKVVNNEESQTKESTMWKVGLEKIVVTEVLIREELAGN